MYGMRRATLHCRAPAVTCRVIAAVCAGDIPPTVSYAKWLIFGCTIAVPSVRTVAAAAVLIVCICTLYAV